MAPQGELTEQQLETFLLDGRGIASDRGFASGTGSYNPAREDSPSHSACAGDGGELGDFNDTLHDAEALIKQLSNIEDEDGMAAGANRRKGRALGEEKEEREEVAAGEQRWCRLGRS